MGQLPLLRLFLGVVAMEISEMTICSCCGKEKPTNRLYYRFFKSTAIWICEECSVRLARDMLNYFPNKLLELARDILNYYTEELDNEFDNEHGG